MLPREVGGLEAEPVEWLRLIEELARINASVGWMAFIQSGVGLTFLDPERFERFRLRGGGRLILAMSLRRLGGKAVKAEGGYRISGRWPFASGSPYATWLGGMSVVCDSAGAPVLDANGQPQRLLAIWSRRPGPHHRHLGRSRPARHGKRRHRDNRPLRP